MDYILHLLDRKLNYLESLGKTRDVAEYYRVKIEYGLIFLMSHLWNENIDKVDAESKEYIFGKISTPSIGSILDMSRRLDIQKSVFVGKKFNEAINSYPKLRNERIGHGFVFQDGLGEYAANLKAMSDLIFAISPILSASYDLVVVLDYANGNYVGMNYKSDGTTFVPWGCPDKIAEFQVGSVYALDSDSRYHRLSPFVHLTSEEEFYLFKDIDENLTGKVKYNQLLRTASIAIEWKELSNTSVEISAFRRKSVNGTIISVIHKNYKSYIEVGVLKRKVVNFLLKDRASVCATIWGHGGVGKTATVQSICEDLANDNSRRFDYIIFTSAKDRYYNYYTGSVEPIEGNINSFEGLVRGINRVMFNDETNDPQRIINTDSKVLIVIDDYETFSGEEKQKIEDFIRSLDISHHKVLVTTRANLIIGDEFQTNELDAGETKTFLLEILRSEFDSYKIEKYEQDLLQNDNYKNVHNITSGRPLFVYQFAYIWMQVGKIDQALSRRIKQEKTAIEFLYGRIYDYLSSTAKDIFVTMGQVVTEDDPTNLIEKVRYILNLENNDSFDNGIRELEKLRIIEIIELRFFKVYSKEILHIMLSYFGRKSDSFRRSVISRIQEVTRDKKLDNESALLSNANAARTSRNEEEVIRLYRSILNRESSPSNMKIQAVLSLADYLFNNRGKREETIKLFKDYEHLFYLNPTFSRMFANYCWATGRKDESIRILLDLFAKKAKIDDRNERLELLGLLMTYRSIDAIQQREDLKDKERSGEISYQEFGVEYEKTKSLFVDICDKQGKKLFYGLRQVQDISSLSSGARQNIVAGLYQYVNLNIRLKKYQDAIAVCEYVMERFPSHFQEQFVSKLEFCKRQKKNIRGSWKRQKLY